MPQLPILPTHVTLSIFHRYEVWAGDRLNQVPYPPLPTPPPLPPPLLPPPPYPSLPPSLINLNQVLNERFLENKDKLDAKV